MRSEEMIREEYHDLKRSLYFCVTKEEREEVQATMYDMLYSYRFLQDQIK